MRTPTDGALKMPLLFYPLVLLTGLKILILIFDWTANIISLLFALNGLKISKRKVALLIISAYIKIQFQKFCVRCRDK